MTMTNTNNTVVIDGAIHRRSLEEYVEFFCGAKVYVTSQNLLESVRKMGIEAELFQKKSVIDDLDVRGFVSQTTKCWQGSLGLELEGHNVAALAANFFSFRVLKDWPQIISWVQALLNSLGTTPLTIICKDDNVRDVFKLVSEGRAQKIHIINLSKSKKRANIIFQVLAVLVRDFFIRNYLAKLNNYYNIKKHSLKKTSVAAFIHTIPEYNFYCKLSPAFEGAGLSVSILRAFVGREYWVSGKMYILDAYLSVKGLFQFAKYRFMVAKKLFQLMRMGFVSQIKYKDIPILPLISADLRYFYLADIPSLIRMILCIHNFIMQRTLDCVLFTTTWNVYEMAVLEAAKKKGIRTVQLMHAALEGPTNAFSEAVNGPAADYYLVWGDYYKRQIELFGRDTRVVATGYPFLDEATNGVSRGMSADIDILILPSPYSERHLVYFIELIVQSLAQFPMLNCVIKMHPSQLASDTELYRGILKSNNLDIPILTSGDLNALIHRSKLIVQTQSTVALETIVRDRPVVDIVLSPEDGVMSLWAMDDAILRVQSAEDLSDCIKKIIIDKDPSYLNKLKEYRESFCKHHFGSGLLDPRASRCVMPKTVQKIILGQI